MNARALLVMVAALSCVTASGAAITQAVDGVIEGWVNWVVDGDSFEMQVRGETVGIRICGINSPERWEDREKYLVGKGYLHDRIHNRILRCVPVDAGTVCDGRSDRVNNGRYVAQCFLDGKDIAVDMVRSQNACDWPAYSGGHYQRIFQSKVCVETKPPKRMRAKR